MASVLVVYYSQSGNTEQMAEEVAAGVRNTGVDVDLKEVDKVASGELADYDGIIMGSPTYYGGMAAELKKLLDESVKLHGQLEDMVGAAFSSAAHVGGGNETTVLDILHAFLIHGMIVPGIADGDHYGTVSVNAPDKRVENETRQLGERVGELVQQLAS